MTNKYERGTRNVPLTTISLRRQSDMIFQLSSNLRIPVSW